MCMNMASAPTAAVTTPVTAHHITAHHITSLHCTLHYTALHCTAHHIALRCTSHHITSHHVTALHCPTIPHLAQGCCPPVNTLLPHPALNTNTHTWPRMLSTSRSTTADSTWLFPVASQRAEMLPTPVGGQQGAASQQSTVLQNSYQMHLATSSCVKHLH
jgi:hypothetical protein